MPMPCWRGPRRINSANARDNRKALGGARPNRRDGALYRPGVAGCSMNWFQTIVLYVGVIDAVAVLVGGLVAAFVVLMGWDAQKLWDRIGPAAGILIGSSLGGAVILGGVHWVIG